MNAQDPLAQLRDIHLPESTGWWPLAWGWWVLAAILLITLGFGVRAWLVRRRRRRYRQQAQAELEQAYRRFRDNGDTRAYLQRLSELLRRAALSALPPQQHSRVAGLTGEPWLEFLDSHLPESDQGFTQGPGRALLAGPYQPNPEADVEALHHLGKHWLTRHQIGKATSKKSGSQKRGESKRSSGQGEAAHHA